MDTKTLHRLSLKLLNLMALALAIIFVAGPVIADRGFVTPDSLDYDQQLKQFIDDAAKEGRTWNSRRSYPYIQKAYQYIEAGNQPAAANELKIYLNKVPDDPEALWKLANIEVTLEQYETARKHFETLASILPDFGAASLRAAVSAKKLTKNKLARASFIKAIKSNSLGKKENIYALKELAAIELNERNDQQAAYYLERSLDYDPRDPELLHQKAIVETRLKNYTAAATNLEKYLEYAQHGNSRQEPLRSLVYLYSKANPDTAPRKLDALRRAYRPEFMQCNLALQSAYVYINQNDYKNAYTTLLNANASQSSCGNDYQKYLETSVSVAAQLNDYAMASWFTDQLIQRAETNEDKSRWLAVKGNINYESKNLKEALSTYLKSESLNHSEDTAKKASEVAWQLKDYKAITTLNTEGPGSNADPNVLERSCSAYLKQKQLNNARPCYQRLADLRPDNPDYHLILSGIHKEQGNQSEAIEEAKIAYSINHDPALALNIGYLIKATDKAAADQWFNQVALHNPSPIARLNVFLALDEQKKPEEVIAKGKALLDDDKELDKEQIILVHRKMAYAFENANQWKQAARAWTYSFKLSRSADDLLSIISSTHEHGDFERTRQILSQVNPERLPQHNKPDFYRLAASTYFHFGDYEKSEEARKYLVAIEPTAQNWFSLAMVEIERGKYPAANNALNEALKLDPGNRSYLMNKAYIAGNNQDYDQALKILTQLPEQENDAELNENTAYLSLKAKKPELAAVYFRKAVKKYDANEDHSPQVDMKMLALRDQIRQLESKYKIQAAQVGCFGSENCQPSTGIQESETGYGFGNLRASYQIHPKLAARAALLWSNKNDSIEPVGKTLTGAIGVEYKPLDKTNLKLSIDRLVKLGDQGQDNTLVRAAWSTNLNEATMQARRQRYTQLYAEANKLLENNQESQLLAEARSGLAISTGSLDLLNPYLYGQIRHQNSKSLDYTTAEAGIGISATMKHARDSFKGERATSTLFAKTGAEVYNSETDKEIRALIGYEFSYQ
ncbi:MAG: tetratricopeptide repeat protein [Thiotrichales bacterium]